MPSAGCSNSHWSRHQRCKYLKMSINFTGADTSVAITGADNSVANTEDVHRSCKGIQAPLCPVGIGSPHVLDWEGNTCQGDCCVFVFGLMWSPEDFCQASCFGRPSFFPFSGLSVRVTSACMCVAESPFVKVKVL